EAGWCATDPASPGACSRYARSVEHRAAPARHDDADVYAAAELHGDAAARHLTPVERSLSRCIRAVQRADDAATYPARSRAGARGSDDYRLCPGSLLRYAAR